MGRRLVLQVALLATLLLAGFAALGHLPAAAMTPMAAMGHEAPAASCAVACSPGVAERQDAKRAAATAEVEPRRQPRPAARISSASAADLALSGPIPGRTPRVPIYLQHELLRL